MNKAPSNAVIAFNLYPATFTVPPATSFVLQFDLYWELVGTTGTTEHFLFGVNASGTNVNRYGTTLTNQDGYFFGLTSDGGTARDVRFYTGGGTLAATEDTTLARYHASSQETRVSGTAVAGWDTLFPNPPFNGVTGGTLTGGVPSVLSTTPVVDKRWTIVRMTYDATTRGVVVSVSPNPASTPVFTPIYTNPNVGTAFDGGRIFIGYQDQFASTSPTGQFALIDNLTVTQFTSVSDWSMF